MRQQYSFGWRPDLPDVRDAQFDKTFRIPARKELPASVDLRENCSPVEDQGELGSCTAQALVGALEYLQIRAGHPVRDLSRLFVYWNERALEGTVFWDAGAMLRSGIKVLKRFGTCREETWPYNITMYMRRPEPQCYEEGLKHQVTAYQRLKNLLELKACLAMGLPFVFGFAVYDSALTDAVAKSGEIPMPVRRIDRTTGGHAVLAVGYDDSEQMLLFRNSWGIRWGQDGYGTMPYAFLESRDLTDDFWCIQATENDLYAKHKIQTGEEMA